MSEAQTKQTILADKMSKAREGKSAKKAALQAEIKQLDETPDDIIEETPIQRPDEIDSQSREQVDPKETEYKQTISDLQKQLKEQEEIIKEIYGKSLIESGLYKEDEIKNLSAIELKAAAEVANRFNQKTGEDSSPTKIKRVPESPAAKKRANVGTYNQKTKEFDYI